MAAVDHRGLWGGTGSTSPAITRPAVEEVDVVVTSVGTSGKMPLFHIQVRVSPSTNPILSPWGDRVTAVVALPNYGVVS